MKDNGMAPPPREGVAVVVPAYNEAERLPGTLEALRSLDGVAEIVVVDDGSRDGTGEAARGERTTVLTLPKNRGKGAALQWGISRVHHDVVLLLDADLGASAVFAAQLVEPVLKDEADVAIATFAAVRPGGFGLVQALARRGIRSLAGVSLRSPLSGQRAIHRRVLEAVPLFAPGFGAEVAFTIDAVRAGFRLREVPVPMTHRETGRDAAGFLHRGRQLWHVARALAPRALTGGPTRRGSAKGSGDDSP